jgi:hypothetical protein
MSELAAPTRDNICQHCNRHFKDKRGLSVHTSKCLEHRRNETTCSYCLNCYSSVYTLERHYLSCAEYKIQKMKEDCDKMKENYMKKEEDLKRELSIEKQSILQHHSTELQDLKLRHQEELHRVKLHEREMEQLLASMEKGILEENKLLRSQNEQYAGKINDLEKDLRVSRNDFAYMSKQLAELKTNATTIITNNVQNNNNQSYQLQIFRPTMIQGKIVPPETMIYSIPSLVNHVYRLGLGNCIRTTDRSRGTTVWNDKDGNEIKDQHSMTIADVILDTLKPELINQKDFLLEQRKMIEKRLRENPEEISNYDVIQEYNDKISFTTSLINKQIKLKKLLAKQIAEQSKNKNDTKLIEHKSSFVVFIKRVQDLLIEHITHWISLDFEDFGRFLKQELPSLIETREMSQNRIHKYIYLQDDNHTKIKVDAGVLQTIFEQVFTKLSPFVHSCLQRLASEAQNYALVQNYLEWTVQPDEEKMDAILEGIYSV